jgi:hypothetical protein
MWDVLKNGYIPLIQLFYKYINEKRENYEILLYFDSVISTRVNY